MMNLHRRTFITLAACATMPRALTAMTAAHSLQVELQNAVAKNQPLIVMVGFASCPYCKVVRQNYLPALQREQKLSVIEIDMHTDTPIGDFKGSQTTHRKIAKDWNIKTSPTLLFFGKDGQEVAKRLIGVSPDFYSAYLEERVSDALASFKK